MNYFDIFTTEKKNISSQFRPCIKYNDDRRLYCKTQESGAFILKSLDVFSESG